MGWDYEERPDLRARTMRYRSAAPIAVAPETSATPAYVTGPGGGGTRERAASESARRRASSRTRLSLPRSMAQRWFAEKTGFSRDDSVRSIGFSARIRQSYWMSTNGPSWTNVHTPTPSKSPFATMVNPSG